MRSSVAAVVAVRAAGHRVELHFGVTEAVSEVARAVTATHCLRLDRAAARHLEEVLTQLVGQRVPPR
jgi:hypothetical protein